MPSLENSYSKAVPRNDKSCKNYLVADEECIAEKEGWGQHL